METERWETVPCTDGRYAVSDHGRVRHNAWGRCRRTYIMRQTVINSGYAMIQLVINGRRCTCLVHRLVADAFVPGKAAGMEVDHLNFDRLDNRAANLAWVTRSENIARSYRAGRRPVTDHQRRARAALGAAAEQRCAVPVQQLTLTDEPLRLWPSAAAASRATGVHQGCIGRCARGLAEHAGGYHWRFA